MNFPEPGMQLVLSVLAFFLHLDGNWRVAAVFAPNFSFICASILYYNKR